MASVSVQWRLRGGQAPYVVQVDGVEAAGATGAVEVSCALAGIDLGRLADPDINVVESGPKTITIEATDAAGNTATRTHTVEVIESAWSAGGLNDGITFASGRTYYKFGKFFEAPEGERIAMAGEMHVDTFDGPENWDLFQHVVEGDRHTLAAFDIWTGERTGTWVTRRQYYGSWETDYSAPLTAADMAVWDRFLATMRYTPFPAGDPRNEPPDPLPAEGVGGARARRQTAAAGTAVCIGPDGNVVDTSPAARRWRPFGQLPTGQQGLRCSEIVTVHPRLLAGDGITVCLAGEIFDDLFNLPAGHLKVDRTLSGDVGGYEYAVVGLTGGDHRPAGGVADPLGLRHATVTVTDATAPGGSRTLTLGDPSNVAAAPPPAGTYTIGFDGVGVAHYGATALNEWRFTFGHRQGQVRITNGGAGGLIKFTEGDLVISRGQPFTTWDDSPFAPDHFTPLLIQHGATTITVTACDTHFHHIDDFIAHYECRIRAAITGDTDNIPDHITVNTAPT